MHLRVSRRVWLASATPSCIAELLLTAQKVEKRGRYAFLADLVSVHIHLNDVGILGRPSSCRRYGGGFPGGYDSQGVRIDSGREIGTNRKVDPAEPSTYHADG